MSFQEEYLIQAYLVKKCILLEFVGSMEVLHYAGESKLMI